MFDLVDKTVCASPSDEIGRHVGLKIPCPQGRVGSTPTSGTQPTEKSDVYWGVRFVGHDEEGHKTYVVAHINHFHQEPGLAERIRNDRLREADIFDVRRHLRRITALRNRKTEFFRVSH